MKKIAIIGIIIFIITCVVIAGCVAEAPKNPITIVYFTSPGCGFCDMMDKDFENLTKYHNGEFILVKHDVNKESNEFLKAITLYKQDAVVPLIIIENVTFSGYKNTTYAKIEEMIVNRSAYIKH